MRFFAVICALALCLSCADRDRSQSDRKNSDYHVAAYIWPSCHDDPVGREVLWGEGHGEWEIIKRGTPRFDGHYQPRRPLWGYEHDDDPEVMERWIDAAADHGVNVFVFDWYWYDGGPFLEGCLNDGFLKARNRDRMQFYVMWANHTVKRNYWNCHRYGDDESVLWSGSVDEENFRKVVDRVIGQYFSEPNYFKIDGRPVFSVFSLDELIASFDGDLERARKGMEYFREETREAGFPDLCLQIMTFGADAATAERAKAIGVDCTTRIICNGPPRERKRPGRWPMRSACLTSRRCLSAGTTLRVSPPRARPTWCTTTSLRKPSPPHCSAPRSIATRVPISRKSLRYTLSTSGSRGLICCPTCVTASDIWRLLAMCWTANTIATRNNL